MLRNTGGRNRTLMNKPGKIFKTQELRWDFSFIFELCIVWVAQRNSPPRNMSCNFFNTPSTSFAGLRHHILPLKLLDFHPILMGSSNRRSIFLCPFCFNGCGFGDGNGQAPRRTKEQTFIDQTGKFAHILKIFETQQILYYSVSSILHWSRAHM